MKYQVSLSLEAHMDLRELFLYISVVLQAPATAKSFLQKIYKGIYSLDEFLERYKLFVGLKKYGLQCRQMPINSFVVIYIVDKDKVIILRIIYGKRDLEKQFSYLHVIHE